MADNDYTLRWKKYMKVLRETIKENQMRQVDLFHSPLVLKMTRQMWLTEQMYRVGLPSDTELSQT